MSEKEDGAEKKQKKFLFGKQILAFLDKGVEASKKGIKSAGDAISDFGDKSVTKIENTQLKSKIEKIYRDLGEYCASLLVEGKNVPVKDENVAAYVTELKATFDKIAKNDESLGIVDEKPIVPKVSSSAVTIVKDAGDDVKEVKEVKAAAKKTTAKATTSKTTAKTGASKAGGKATAKTSTGKTTASKTSAKATGAKTTASKASAAKTTTAKTAAKTTAKKTTATKTAAKTTAKSSGVKTSGSKSSKTTKKTNSK